MILVQERLGHARVELEAVLKVPYEVRRMEKKEEVKSGKSAPRRLEEYQARKDKGKLSKPVIKAGGRRRGQGK